MRKQFVKTVEEILSQDDKLVLLLGDIGIYGFRNAFANFPNRVYNIGILEQATISLSAGLAKTGLIPVVHSIAPFLVERSFEQLKIDFGYQRCGGNFISVGASYDYASLGCTHHCPGDVGILQNIPNMEIILPGSAVEFDSLFHQVYANGNPSYIRLSESSNLTSLEINFGKANVLKTGSLATVIAFGPTLSSVIQAIEGLDVGLLYYTTLKPFDGSALLNNIAPSGKVLMIEPFYSGTMNYEVSNVLRSKYVKIRSIGVPRDFLRNYGDASQHDKQIGLDVSSIRNTLEDFIDE